MFCPGTPWKRGSFFSSLLQQPWSSPITVLPMLFIISSLRIKKKRKKVVPLPCNKCNADVSIPDLFDPAVNAAHHPSASPSPSLSVPTSGSPAADSPDPCKTST